jgi:hypothetical protein
VASGSLGASGVTAAVVVRVGVGSGSPGSSGRSGTAETCDPIAAGWTTGSATAGRAGSFAVGAAGTGIGAEDAAAGLAAVPRAGSDELGDVAREAGKVGNGFGVGLPDAGAGRLGSELPGSARSRNVMVAPGVHAGAWVAWMRHAANTTWSSSEPMALKMMASSGTRRRPGLRSKGE